MISPRERLASASLYLCTDARRERGDLAEFVAAALRGGVDIVQLRDKGSAGEREFGALEAAQEIDIVAQLREIAHDHGALVAVNDRADVAFAARADVLHLGQDDLPVSVARQIVGPDVVIGRSTHDGAQARAAAAGAEVLAVQADAAAPRIVLDAASWRRHLRHRAGGMPCPGETRAGMDRSGQA